MIFNVVFLSFCFMIANKCESKEELNKTGITKTNKDGLQMRCSKKRGLSRGWLQAKDRKE